MSDSPDDRLPRSRQDWVGATQFHEKTDAEVLALVAARVQEATAPVVLLDLDSTLYDTTPRHHAIVREWIAGTPSVPPAIVAAVETLEDSHVSYSTRDLFVLLGLDVARPDISAACDALKEFWRPRFFSSEYLKHDRPYPGAADFVQRLYEMHSQIAYLTGRDSPGMEIGTRVTLGRDGFPIDQERTHLLMKPAREGDDMEFKVGAARALRSWGTLVASFENEPRNLMGLYKEFPDAIHVFVETICSETPAPVGLGLYKLRGFPSFD